MFNRDRACDVLRGDLPVEPESVDDRRVGGRGAPTPVTRFFTTKDVGHGTGLGLAIARRIVVDQHAGSLIVESEPGRTSFTAPRASKQSPPEAAHPS